MQARQQAKQEGQPRYTGTPCKRCASAVRYTSSAACVQCVTVRATATRKAATPADTLADNARRTARRALVKRVAEFDRDCAIQAAIAAGL